MANTTSYAAEFLVALNGPLLVPGKVNVMEWLLLHGIHNSMTIHVIDHDLVVVTVLLYMNAYSDPLF